VDRDLRVNVGSVRGRPGKEVGVADEGRCKYFTLFVLKTGAQFEGASIREF